jgi:RNA polymerase sigma-70 factor (ECF subfamily)
MRAATEPVIGREQAELRFERLYAQHGRAVLAYAVRRASVDDAADIVAETFLVAWRRLDDVPVEDARLWLYGVARRVLANQQRSERRRQRLADRLRQELPAVLEAVPALDAQAGAVEAALAQLGPEDREVLRLSAWEELMPVEIATVLGVSPVAVRSRLHRARRRLRSALRRTREPARSTPVCLEEAR